MPFENEKISKQIGRFVINLTFKKNYTAAFIRVEEVEAEDMNTGSADRDYVTMDEILQFLKEQNVKSGVDLQAIAAFVASRKIGEDVIIAKAKMPQDGKDAEIEMNFDFSKSINLVQDEEGNIDFKSLNWFHQVKKGQEIAYKIPATEGIPGENVKGELIVPKVGKDAHFRYGKNVSESEDGLKLIAESDGRLEFVDAKISVNEILVINGDVDASVGNIDFLGGVIVKGDVKTGYRINAKGSLEVNGVIEACGINVAGDLIVKGGIQGSDTFQIETKGSLVCKFIENANVFAASDITADYIIHSKVISGGKITLNSKKGLIAGGEVFAKESIVASVIGSGMGTKTSIVLGNDVEKSRQIDSLKEKLNTLKKETEALNPIIESGKEMLQKGKMDLIKKITFTKSLKKYNENINEIQKIQDQIHIIEISMKHVKFSYLDVKKAIYPGVKVTIIDNVRYIKDIQRACRIYIKGNEIAIEKR